jgi:hypothetical protein
MCHLSQKVGRAAKPAPFGFQTIVSSVPIWAKADWLSTK